MHHTNDGPEKKNRLGDVNKDQVDELEEKEEFDKTDCVIKKKKMLEEHGRERITTLRRQVIVS